MSEEKLNSTQRPVDTPEEMEASIRAHFQKLKGAQEQLNILLDAKFFSCDPDERVLTIKADPVPWMANPDGLMHGGIIASYLDYTMGLLSVYYSGWKMTPTLNMNVNYMRPVKIGKPICVRARLLKTGNKINFLEGSIFPEDRPGFLLASSTGSYWKPPKTGRKFR